MWLRFKIFFCYVALLLLLFFIISLFRHEQTRRNGQYRESKEMLSAHQLAEKSYVNLLDLFLTAETAVTWEYGDWEEYGRKRKNVCDSLRLLKKYVHSLEQQERIDSLCLLLENKEQLFFTAMRNLQEWQNIADIVGERIPVILSEVRKQSQGQTIPLKMESYDPNGMVSRKKNFWDIFRRKEKKSAYLQQKEQMERKQEQQTASSPVVAARRMLLTLNDQVIEEQERRKAYLSVQMDSLYGNNAELNRKMNALVTEFEKETDARFTSKYEAFILDRGTSYRTVAGLALSVSLLTIVFYAIIHRDINKKYRYQKELEASDRKNRELLQSKKDMMLAIAHDLRSPLATISGSADLLPGEKDGRRKAKYVENIRHASEYMLSLVNTLMDFYLLDTGQTQSYERIFHLESLFKETADNYAPLAQRKSLRLSTCFSGTDVVVCGDKGHLQQIVNNLLSNAVKFTKEGSVRMEAEYRNGELRLSVRDTGTGMDGTDAERIFTAFERLENARDVSGFGLGLAICSRLVSRMGGSIRVESRKGKGSDFIVLLPLPLADGKSPLETEKLSSGLRMDGTRVLLLDDDLRQLGIVREMLRRHRAACDCCQDSSELISRLRENEYDVLLMDIQMPDMDGFAVLELLRRSNIPQARAIPAIALTARMDDEREYLARGFAGCIRKPFTMESLAEGVTRVTGKKGNGDWKPDFSLILTGEDNRREMLEVFIAESRKDLSLLHEALEKGDRETVRDILHKNLPLWDTLRLDFPIEELRRITTTAPGSWTAEDLAGIREIERAANRLLRYAINMRKEEQ